MKASLFRLGALGLVAILAACASPTSDTGGSNNTPATKTLASIAVSPTSVTFTLGGTVSRTVAVTGTYSDGSKASITDATFTSADLTKVTVATAAGVTTVTGIAATSSAVLVTATKEGKTASVSVTVNPAVVAPSGVVATFDEATAPTLADFGGNASSISADPANSSNKVLKIVKSSTAETWAGTTLSTGYNASIPQLLVTSADTKLTLRVYSPAIGVKIKVKAEDADNGAKSHETDQLTTVSDAWETLTFDFSAPSAGTNAFNTTDTYNKLSVFADFGVTPSATETFYIDDVTFLGSLGSALSPPTTGLATPAADAGSPSVASNAVLVVYSSHNDGTNYVPAAAIAYQNWWNGGNPSSFATGTTSVIKLGNMGSGGSTGLALTPHLDVSSHHTFHADVWVDSGKKVQFKIVTTSGGELVVDLDVSSSSQAWKSLEVDLSTTAIAAGLTEVQQIGIINADTCPNTYLDNIYFH